MGFAGISSLVSNAEVEFPLQTYTENDHYNKTGKTASDKSSQEYQSVQSESENSQQQPSSSFSFKWLLVLAVVGGAFWFSTRENIPQSNIETTVSSEDEDSQPSVSIEPKNVAVLSMPQEIKPPAGQNQILSTAEIRYCLAENIRIDGAQIVVGNVDSELDRFNEMVADYNSRCGSFRYRDGALENARGDIEPYHNKFLAEGRNRFNKSSGTVALPSPPVANSTVKAVQVKLNQLGYKAGSADGLMGGTTRSAIIAFQKNHGIEATGVADHTLLLQLKNARPKALPPQPENKTTKLNSPSKTLHIPANAWSSGSNWYCNDGYKKVEDKCVSIFGGN